MDSKGKTIGHVTLLEDIVEPEPEVEVDPETAEEKQLREQQAIDKKLAGQLSSVVENGLDQVKPILNQITMVRFPHIPLQVSTDHRSTWTRLPELRRKSLTRRRWSKP